MSDTTQSEELLSILNAINLYHDILLEVRQAHLRLKLDFDWQSLLWLESHLIFVTG